MSKLITAARITRLCSSHSHIIILSASMSTFGEIDRKAGYNHKTYLPLKERLKEGFKILKDDIKLFAQEKRDQWDCDHRFEFTKTDGDYYYFWKFNGVDSLDDWVVTTDRDNLEGHSKAKLSLSKNNKALFQGYLSQKVPKDGVISYAGYANLRSPLKYKSFGRYQPYDWSMFTHLVLRVRGDGRPFNINVHMERQYNLQWFDMYSFTLFTRGGPYWQIAKIPFSKFFLANKGRIQDEQRKIELNLVRTLGFTLADGYEGPFQLEIDYIGLVYDESHRFQVDFEYETYQTDFITVY